MLYLLSYASLLAWY